MSKYSEQTFDSWSKPASETEEQRIANAISMIKDAIRCSDILKNKNIEVFVQGSYANNTNVRANSDVDVCIMLKDTFFAQYPEGKSDSDYGFVAGTNNFDTYRSDLIRALNEKYGTGNVTPGNKSIKITGNSYRVQADAVPAFQYKNFISDQNNDPENFIEGIKFLAQNTKESVINYPKIHIANGIVKNTNTQRRYKRVVRIFKRTRYKMIEDGKPINSGITSFFIECLLWNTPDSLFNDYDTWSDTIRQIISHLFHAPKEEESFRNWVEVSGMFYLFHSGRKWNAKMANDFLRQMWDYLEFST